MNTQHTPITAGERRGLIALAILALLVVAATLAVKMSNRSSSVEAEAALPSTEQVSGLPDSVSNPQKIVRKKPAKKKSASRKSVRRQPDQRDFLNERND